MFSSFPILTRAYRTQWRKPALLFTAICAHRTLRADFRVELRRQHGFHHATRDINARLGEVGRDLWLLLAWLQTALALLVPPALGAGTLARERERGLLDGLLMAPSSHRASSSKNGWAH